MGIISEKLFRYDFSALDWHSELPQDLTGGFVLRLSWNGDLRRNSTLLELPGQLTLRNREARTDEERENVSPYPMPDGSIPVLEITLHFTVPDRPAWKEMSVGVPLSLLTGNTLIAVYDTVRLQLFCGDTLLNENYTAGTLNPPCGVPAVSDQLLNSLSWSCNVTKINRREIWVSRQEAIDFYQPSGFNVSLGDVVLCVRGDEFHLLYLIDRHHHGGRWGAGAHIFNHLVSTDLVNWKDYGPVFELEHWTQTTGTGSMFVFRNTFYIAFGWHTERMVEPTGTVRPQLEAELQQDGQITAHAYDEFPGLYPTGASYLTSQDGIHFTPSRKVIHGGENPGIIPEKDGSLKLIEEAGTWHAPAPDGPWKLTQPDFPPNHQNSPIHNSAECPCEFHFGHWKYLLLGRTGFWMAPENTEEWHDMAMDGMDIYDGLMVPMAAVWHGRLILAGWPSFGRSAGNWASFLLFRELLQRQDGRLDMRWLPEALPQFVHAANAPLAPDRIPLEPCCTQLLEMTVVPSPEGRFAVRFTDPAQSDSDCLFQLDFSRKEAQFSTVSTDSAQFAPPVKSVRRMAAEETSLNQWAQRRCFPYQSGDFVLENVDVMDKPFTLKLICHSTRKLNGTAIDVEIAGRRTMITMRPQWHPLHAAIIIEQLDSRIEALALSSSLHG